MRPFQLLCPRFRSALLLAAGLLVALPNAAWASRFDEAPRANTSLEDSLPNGAAINTARDRSLGAPPPTPRFPERVPIDASDRVANRRLVIRLAQRRVYVHEGDKLLVSYPIAVGREGWETPKGEFKIFQMLQDPSWQHPWTGSIVPPGPDNPLGRRWIGFWTDGTNAIGFHGTPNESLVGQAVSHGCLRMKNKDVETLFAMVGNGTTVVVE